MVERIPMGRTGEIDEIAALVAWLASEECSFSTGAVFDITGKAARLTDIRTRSAIIPPAQQRTLEETQYLGPCPLCPPRLRQRSDNSDATKFPSS